MSSLLSLWQQLYQRGKFPPFIILRSQEENSETLQKFSYQFIDLLFHARGKPPYSREVGHEDIQIVRKENDASLFRLEDQGVLEFNRFIQYGPRFLKRKLAFVMDAQDIPDVLANKWLKILEEPHAQVSIIFTIPGQIPLLPTIESRAVTFALPLSSPTPFKQIEGKGLSFLAYWQQLLKIADDQKDLLPDLYTLLAKKASPWELFESLKSRPQIEKEFFALATSFVSRPSTPLSLKIKWLELMNNWLPTAREFHNPKQSVWHEAFELLLNEASYSQEIR